MNNKQKQGSQKIIADPQVMNMHNPTYANDIEFAFESAGVKYYNFKQDSEIRYGRYIVMQAFLQEYYLRIDLSTLKGNIKKLQGWLNPQLSPGGGEARIEMGKALELLSIMEQRANIAFEPDTVYRLASCLYFDEEENLSKYDKGHNDRKIAAWKEAGTTDFFFHKLFQELSHLKITSKTALQNYLDQVPELLRGWSLMEGTLSR